MRAGTWLLLASALCGSAAAAHTKSESHSVWTVTGNTASVTLDLPLIESARLATASEAQPADATLLAYLGQHLAVLAADGKACSRSAARSLAATAQFRRFELHFQCQGGAPARLHSSVLLELVPSHLMFARIQVADGDFAEQFFTGGAPDIEIAAAAGPGNASASFFSYVLMGINHILTGPDHVSFLLGLVLLSRRPRDLVYVVTGFTLGHSVTLAIAVAGYLRPYAQYIDALVALTILMIGVENMATATGEYRLSGIAMGLALAGMAVASAFGIGSLPALLLAGAALFCACYLQLSGQLHAMERLRILVTLVFGFIHGFGFASGLLEQRLPSAALAKILVGFNLGVEAGQLLLVAALLGLAALCVRLRIAPSRALVVDISAAALVGLGCYWFVVRSYSG